MHGGSITSVSVSSVVLISVKEHSYPRVPRNDSQVTKYCIYAPSGAVPRIINLHY